MKAILSQELSYSAAMLAMNMALLWSCGLYLIFSEKKREMGRMTGLVVNVVLSVIFLIAISTVAYIAHRNGYSNIVAIFALLMALAILGVRLVRISDTNKKPALAMLLMLGWMVGMLYVTMISRIGEESGPDININPFLAFEGVIESSYLIRHALLNVALFMPLGVILRAMEKENAEHQAQLKREKEAAQAQAERLQAKALVMKANCGGQDKLFGSITAQDIVSAVSEQFGETIDKKAVKLDEPIRKLGSYVLSVKLHPEVKAKLKVQIDKKED